MNLGRILLPSLAFVFGLTASIYLVVWRWLHKSDAHARALLFWAISLLLMYWFQVPAVLVGLGITITVTDFNLFFALSFPVTFLALMLLYLGVLQIKQIALSRKKKMLLFMWFAAAIIFFAYYFIINKGIIETYVLPLGGNIVFYMPMRLMIIAAAVKLLLRPEMRTPAGISGMAAVIGESVLGLARNVFIINKVLLHPPQFWYSVISDSQFFFITQALSIIMLAFGFFFLHLVCHRLEQKKSPYLAS